MSENNKFLVRPKVRFSPVSDSIEKHQQTENIGFISTTKPNGPKIKSVVTLTQPIRIVSQDKTSNIDRNVTHKNHVTEKDSVVDLSNNLTNLCLYNDSKKAQESPACNNLHVGPGTQWPLNDMINTDNIKANQETLGTHCTRTVSSKLMSNDNITPSSVLHSEKPVQKVKNGLEEADPSILKPSLKNVGKENHRNHKDKMLNSKKIKGESTQADKCKSIVQRNKSVSTEKIKRISTTSAVSKPITVSHSTNKTNGYKTKVPSANYMVRGIMPCLKFSKTGTKSKSSPVKKTVMRDIIGHKIKPYVGPGVPRKNNSQHRKSMEDADNISSIAVTERLSKPDYNSIRCTFNKLNEVKNEKIVTDIEHLPTSYKNLMNRKISAALDFLPDEITYKNLVNLSVDEKQLPSRLTRSKDPEPRHKDIVPQLSDFFKPEHAEEYSTGVSVKPRQPEIQDRWNAFRISDKIFEWKHNTDYSQ